MKSQDFISENNDSGLKKRFAAAFSAAGLPVHTVDINNEEDGWINVSARGMKNYRVGTRERISFMITNCWWEPNSDEISGKVVSQKNSTDKKYSQVADFTEDQATLDEFATKASQFISAIINAEVQQYRQGERDYWAKGGTGMMPGSVKKDYK